LPLLKWGDAIEEGQRESAAGDGLGYGELDCGARVVAVGGLKVDGSEVAAGGDAALGEGGADAIAVDLPRQAYHVDKPAGGSVGQGKGRQFESGKRGEQRVVALGGGAAQDE